MRITKSLICFVLVISNTRRTKLPFVLSTIVTRATTEMYRKDGCVRQSFHGNVNFIPYYGQKRSDRGIGEFF